MSFTPNYSVGGVLDEVKKIHFPPGLWPDQDKLKNFVKGFRIPVPATIGTYTQIFTVPWDFHIIGASVVCSGYYDGDFWELSVGSESRVESCYTKELPETLRLDETYPVYPAGTKVTVSFHNDSGTSKTVWLNLKFLHG